MYTWVKVISVSPEISYSSDRVWREKKLANRPGPVEALGAVMLFFLALVLWLYGKVGVNCWVHWAVSCSVTNSVCPSLPPQT